MSNPIPDDSAFTLMEAGFKIIPGKEAEFFERQSATVPVAMSQPGFVAVYGGPILDSNWLYFGVRFSSAVHMDAWHFHQHHQEVEDGVREMVDRGLHPQVASPGCGASRR